MLSLSGSLFLPFTSPLDLRCHSPLLHPILFSLFALRSFDFYLDSSHSSPCRVLHLSQLSSLSRSPFNLPLCDSSSLSHPSISVH